VVSSLREAATEAPPGFEFRQIVDIPLVDSQPVGFAASYTTTVGEVTVIFLVLDLGQSVQRQAARLAGGIDDLPNADAPSSSSEQLSADSPGKPSERP
jgi:hypothetical protein